MRMSGKRVSETRLRMAQIMTPSDANILGYVFGGSILAMVDLTASATAQKFAGRICVTASFDRVDFHQPVEVGNLVEMEEAECADAVIEAHDDHSATGRESCAIADIPVVRAHDKRSAVYPDHDGTRGGVAAGRAVVRAAIAGTGACASALPIRCHSSDRQHANRSYQRFQRYCCTHSVLLFVSRFRQEVCHLRCARRPSGHPQREPK